MYKTHNQSDVIRRLIAWAAQRDAVRAMLLTSTRANPHADVDMLSDYDVVLVVQDIHPFFENRSWLNDFGEVLVVYWDQMHLAPDYNVEQFGNVTLYQNGLHIDFTLWPVELMQQIAAAPMLPADLNVGYTVLLDKDRLTHGMPAPTYSAYIPAQPSDETYQTFIQEFFSDVPYVAKCLWRDELMPAKWCLDYDMKHNYLRRMLEWRMECDHGWSATTGNLGRGLKKRLPPNIWAELEQTYVGAGIADNWEALFKTIVLFRRVAVEVADHLGYTYPHDLDRGMTAYAQHVKRLERYPTERRHIYENPRNPPPQHP